MGVSKVGSLLEPPIPADNPAPILADEKQKAVGTPMNTDSHG
ncbi:hypothetical protein DSM104443_02248 [Usitatibacter rugosus]|uniref:Uncharacterized protein n=1 Tax=Usitatibacter rugosus TaxID=2732067 RepID=A0A6M4GVH4_9PROT|nr:hypothetical protein DSM104443_02248 [Usitatibacter rugosus]